MKDHMLIGTTGIRYDLESITKNWQFEKVLMIGTMAYFLLR